MANPGNVNYVTPSKVQYTSVLPLGLPSKASLVKVSPSNGGSNYSPTGTSRIEFYLNSDGLMDCDHTTLNFGIKNTSATPVRLSSSCKSVIRRFRVYGPSGQVIVDSDYDNYLLSLLSDVQLTQDWADTVGNSLLGFPKKSAKAITAKPIIFSNCQDNPVIFAGATVQFEMNLDHIFNNDKYIPLRSINSPGLMVMIDLELPVVALRGTPAADTGISSAIVPITRSALNYQIVSPQIHMQIVRFPASYTAFLDGLVASTGVQLHFDRFTLYRRVVQSTSLTTEVLNHRSRSIKSIIGMFQRGFSNGIARQYEAGDDTNDASRGPGARDRNHPADTTRYYPDGFKFQLRVGNDVMPQAPLETEVELYRELMHSLGDSAMSGRGGNRIDRKAYTFQTTAEATLGIPAGNDFRPALVDSDEQVCRFAFGYDFEPYQDKVQAGLSTMNGEALELILNGTIADYDNQGATMYVWVLDDAVVTISPDGNVSTSY